MVAPDLSKNTKLEIIGFSSAKFSTIDVSKNTELKSLNVGGDVFNSLDVTNNTKLTNLAVTGTITTLDLTKSAQLEVLNISNTKISEIDVTNCPYLRSIDFGSTPIVEIDLSRNLLLTSALAYMANSLKTVWLSKGRRSRARRISRALSNTRIMRQGRMLSLTSKTKRIRLIC